MKRAWLGLALVACVASGCKKSVPPPPPPPVPPASGAPAPASPAASPTGGRSWTFKLPWLRSSTPTPTPTPVAASGSPSIAVSSSTRPVAMSGSPSGSPGEENDVASLLEDGIDQVNGHNDDQAIKLLTKANNMDPRNGDVAFWLFTAYKDKETTPDHSPDRTSQSYQWAHQVIQRMPQTTQADTAQKFITMVENLAPSEAHGSLTAGRVLDAGNRCLWLGFSPNGKALATLCSAKTNGDAATVVVFDVESGKSWIPEATNVAAAAFSPDGRKLITSGDDTTVWDVATHKPLARIDMGTISLAWVDEKTIAAAIDNSVLLYLVHSAPAPGPSGSPSSALPSGEELPTHFQQAALATPQTNVVCLAVSPDHKLLATASQEEIKLWDVHTGESLKTLEAKYTASMKFSPDSDVLATAGRDRTIRFWDVKSGKPEDKTYDHTGANFFNDAFGWSHGLLASAVDDEVKVWELKTGDFLHVARTHTHGATACDFSPDGKMLATTGDDGHIQLWEVTP